MSLAPAQPVVYLELSDGYSFRNLFEYLTATNTDANLAFTKDRISYRTVNAAGNLINEFELYPHEIPNYRLATEGKYNVGVNLTQFKGRITHGIAKQDGIVIYTTTKKDSVYGQINTAKRSAGSSGVAECPIISVGEENFEFHPYKRKADNPNCTVSISEFVKVFSSFPQQKCAYVLAKGFPRGVVFEGFDKEGKVVKIHHFGQLSNADPGDVIPGYLTQFISNVTAIKENKKPPPIVTVIRQDVSTYQTGMMVVITSDMVKSLIKLRNTSSSGTVKFYFEEMAPMRIMCNIGTYGNLTIHMATGLKNDHQ